MYSCEKLLYIQGPNLNFSIFSGAQAVHVGSDKSHSGHESDAWKAWLLVREISSWMPSLDKNPYH